MSELDDILDAVEKSNYGPSYANFGIRLVAYIIDSIIIGIPIVASLYLFFDSESFEVTDVNSEVPGFYLWYFFAIVVYWLYYAYFESSDKQATPGKSIMGLKVTDLDGNPISFLKATGRHFGKFISSLIFYIGYLMAAFTAKKQALHDIIAECLVLKK